MKKDQRRNKILIGMMIVALQPFSYLGAGRSYAAVRGDASNITSSSVRQENVKQSKLSEKETNVTQANSESIELDQQEGGVERLECYIYDVSDEAKDLSNRQEEEQNLQIYSVKKISAKKINTKNINSDGSETYYNFFAPDTDELYGYSTILTKEAEKTVYTKIVETVLTNIDSIDLSSQDFEITVAFDQSLTESGLTESEIKGIINAIRIDHPEWYWMASQYGMASNFTSLQICGDSQFSSKITRSQIESDLMTLVKDFESTSIVQGDGVYNKVLKIHDFIINHTYYNLSATNAHNIVGVLLDQEGVCESYAKASQLFFNYFDIPNVYVVGTNQNANDSGHAWNQVFIKEGSSDGVWVNYDATWDDLAVDTESSSKYKEFNGVSYRYFCRNDQQFAHLTSASGDYKPDYNINTCSVDTYNYFKYFKEEGLVYLESVNNVSTLMTNIQTLIDKGTLKAQDGIYKVRLGYDAAIKLSSIKDKLVKDKLTCTYLSGGKEGDQFVGFQDSRIYKITNDTSATGGTLYSVLSNYEAKSKWIKGTTYQRSISNNTFYIQTDSGYQVETISYRIGTTGTPQYLTLSQCLTVVDATENLFMCTLPFALTEGSNVIVNVTYTTDKMVKLAFEQSSYSGTYGDAINVKVKVTGDGTHIPNGTFTLYKDSISDSSSIIGGLNNVPIENGYAQASINSTQADLPVGTYKVYAVYQGDTYYQSMQIAATEVTVSKAVLHYAPNASSRKYGESNQLAGTFTTADFKYGETEAVVSKVPTLSTTATDRSAVGNYTITAGTDGEAANYNIQLTSKTANLTITKATPNISITANKTTAVIGETIRFTATISNPFQSSLTDNFPSDAQTYLYLGNTNLGAFTKTATAGVYTYDYVVSEGAEATLSFSVKTDTTTNYEAGGSTSLPITVDKNSFLVQFDNRGYGIQPASQQIASGEKVTNPGDLVDSTFTYQFDGWYTSKSYDTRWSFDTDTVTKSMTLYAKWKQAELSNITGVVVTPNTDWDYDGSEHPVASITGTQTGDRVTYTLDGVSSSEIPTVKNAGTYKLKVKVQRNWYNPYETTVEIVVNQVEPTLNLAAEVNKKYTGSPVDIGSISVTGINGESVSSDSVSYVYYVDEYYTTKTSSQEGATEEGKAPVKAGTYYVKVIFGAAGNYKEKVGTTKLIIGKTTLTDLSNQRQEVSANQADEYEYTLTQLLPTNLDFGTVTFVNIRVEDTDGILSSEPEIEDGVLRYSLKSVDSGKKAIITITIQSQNYEDRDVKLIISTKNKTTVTISGVTTPDVDYSGQPYSYQGTYVVKNSTTNQQLTLELETLYTGTTIRSESYSSAMAPTEAGDYTLTLSVPSKDKTYTGSVSYSFKIKVKDLIITAEGKVIRIGSDQPDYTATYDGLAQSDSVTGVLFTCSYVKNDAVNGKAGTYAIVPSGATISNVWNYNVIYKGGTLTVKDVHTITFNMGITGATNPASIQAAEGDKVTMPAATASRDGYDFAGWTDGNSNVYAVSEQYTMIDGNVTFTAKWKVKVTLAKITADYLGSRLPVGSEISTSNIRVTAHYTDGTTEEVFNYTLSTRTVDKEGDNVITITYNSLTSNILVTGFVNNVARISASYSGTVLAGQPLDSTKLTVTATYEDGSSAVITKDYTINTYTITPGENILTIKYSEKTTTLIVTGVPAEGSAVLTFDSQGGSSVNKAVVQIGKTYSPESPVRAGYIFKGWYTKPSGQGDLFTSSSIITGNATYYAYWEEASGSVSRIYASYQGELLSGQLKATDFLVMAVYDNGQRGMITGFTLSTTTLNVGLNKIIITYGNVTTIVTLTVPDQPRNLTVTLKESSYVSGYTLTKDDMTVVATLADGASKEVTEYTLSNNKLKTGSNTVTVTYLGATATIEVEGKRSCTIYFNSKGGSTIKSIQVVSGKVIGSLPTPTKEKCTFQGWYFDTDYSRKCTSTNKLTTDVTLYAKWKENKPYTISNKYINVRPLGQDSISIPGAEGVQWVSDDLNIASIDSDGVITGINPGTTIITGYTADGYELTCKVTVGKEVKKIQVGKTKVTLESGTVYNIKATVSPSNAVTKKLTYSSTDTSVATVDQKGRVITRNKGTCYITIQTTDSSNLKKKIKITVK